MEQTASMKAAQPELAAPILGRSAGHDAVAAHVGEGGMGTLHPAQQVSAGKAAAVAMLPEARPGSGTFNALLHEARAASYEQFFRPIVEYDNDVLTPRVHGGGGP